MTTTTLALVVSAGSLIVAVVSMANAHRRKLNAADRQRQVERD